ncbi:MAG: alpha/beta hydrolase [Acidobacteria bacterium]|nr:MAG: alpha/beta hydrolase [Acidobacteriota bacterium]
MRERALRSRKHENGNASREGRCYCIWVRYTLVHGFGHPLNVTGNPSNHNTRRSAGWTLTASIALGLGVFPLAAESAIHDAYATVPGARIFYRDSGGDGVPVILLHAATGSSRVWDNQFSVFAAAGYRVIAFDRRGWGRTVLDGAGPQPGTAADDLLNLLAQLGLDRVHVIGTAAGGFVALDFALSYPKHVRSLVIANSIGGVQDPDYVALGRRLRPPQFDALPPEIRELGPSYRASNAAGTGRWVELEKMSRSATPPTPPQPLRNRITFALLGTIEVPTLLMTGDADMYAPPPILRLFAERIKGAEVFIVPEAGHSAYWEQPELFNRAVLNFFGKH